jgi:TRAP-type C4-dicarboxylate transport system permease small subunit
MQPSANFCSNCGKSLRVLPSATTVSRQIIVYLISFFLAPFGLWYAWKYLRQDDRTSRIIGTVSLALTIVAVALAIRATAGPFSLVNQYLNALHDPGF